jgi:FkbM family methyltransferase
MSFAKYTYYFQSIFTLLGGIQPLPLVLRLFFGEKPKGYPLIRLRRSGLQFRTRSAMDVWAVKETQLDHFYERCGFPLQDGWTVIDIGGGIGDFTIRASRDYPHSRVFAFEPTPGSFALLQENLKLNGIQNATAYPNAVWSVDGEVEIDTGAGEPVQFTSQARGEQPAPAAVPGKVTVRAHSLASVFDLIGAERCDLMKIDCEGAEYEILFKAPETVLRRIDRIVMEYHDNAGPYTHRDMARFLTEQGYQVKVVQNVVHPYLGYLSAAR